MASTFSRNSPLAGVAAEAFIKTFEEDLLRGENSYALILSQEPDAQIAGEKNSPMNTHNALDGIMGVVLPEFSATVGTKRWKWEPADNFTPWDSTVNMFGKRFYCDHRITDGPNAGAHGVWLLLDKPADGSGTTTPPSKLSYEPVKGIDGYVWKFLYLISGIERRFLDSGFLPVPKTISVTDEWKKFSSTDPRLTNKQVEEDSRKNLAGTISSLQISDYNTWKNLRWNVKPQFFVTEDPGTDGRSAKIKPIMHYVDDTNFPDNSGWKITNFEVTDGGKNYSPFAAFSLYVTEDPKQNSYSGTYTSDYIFGTSRKEGQKRELLHASVFGPDGGSNYRELLYANMLRVNVLITAEEIAKHVPVGTEISSVSLVQNPYIDNALAHTKIKYQTPSGGSVKTFSAAKKVTVSSATALANGKLVRSTKVGGTSSSNKKGVGQIAASETIGSSTTYTIVNGKNFDTSLLYDVNETSISAGYTEFTSKPATSSASATAATKSSDTGAGSTTYTVTSVEDPRITSGPETRVIGEFSYGATTVDSDQGVLIKLTLGQEEN